MNGRIAICSKCRIVNEDDNVCPNCGAPLFETDVTMREYNGWTVGNQQSFIYSFLQQYDDEALEAAKKEEVAKQEYAKSFDELYEYDVVTILNKEHGQVDRGRLKQTLMDYAKKGWKLHTVYSNELGKNAIKLLGLGLNSTACEDVLIFERRIKDN